MGGTGEQTKVSNKQPRDPVKLNLPKNNSKFTLKTASGKPSNIVSSNNNFLISCSKFFPLCGVVV